MTLLVVDKQVEVIETEVLSTLVIHSKGDELIELVTTKTIVIQDTPVVEVVEIAATGAQGLKGDQGDDATGFVIGTATVLVGETKVIDIATDLSIEWSIVVNDIAQSMLKRCKTVGLMGGSYCTYEIQGDKIPFKVSVSSNNNLQLSITNFHINDLFIRFSKTSIGV